MKATWREQQKAQLRERIYTVSLRLLLKRGLERTSIERIANEVGIAKGTFFNHFESKEHVIEEWFRRLSDGCLTEVESRSFRTAKSAVQALASEKALRALENSGLVRLKAQVAPKSTLLLDTERDLNRRIEDYLVGHIEAGKKNGELRSDLDAQFLAHLLIDTLTGTVRAWVLSEEELDLKKMFRNRIDYLFRAAVC